MLATGTRPGVGRGLTNRKGYARPAPARQVRRVFRGPAGRLGGGCGARAGRRTRSAPVRRAVPRRPAVAGHAARGGRDPSRSVAAGVPVDHPAAGMDTLAAGGRRRSADRSAGRVVGAVRPVWDALGPASGPAAEPGPRAAASVGRVDVTGTAVEVTSDQWTAAGDGLRQPAEGGWSGASRIVEVSWACLFRRSPSRWLSSWSRTVGDGNVACGARW